MICLWDKSTFFTWYKFMFKEISTILFFSRMIVDALIAWLDQKKEERCRDCGDDVVRIRTQRRQRSRGSRRRAILVMVLKMVATMLGASQGTLGPNTPAPTVPPRLS